MFRPVIKTFDCIFNKRNFRHPASIFGPINPASFFGFTLKLISSLYYKY